MSENSSKLMHWARRLRAIVVSPVLVASLLTALYFSTDSGTGLMRAADDTKKVTVEGGVEVKTSSTTDSTPTLTVHKTREQSVALTIGITYKLGKIGNLTVKGSWGEDRTGPKTVEVKSIQVGIHLSW